MTPPPPLSCAACGQSPATLRLVDLEAESALTGDRSPKPFGWEPRCQACWDAYRRMRQGARR